jgi:hypothetical protein
VLVVSARVYDIPLKEEDDLPVLQHVEQERALEHALLIQTEQTNDALAGDDSVLESDNVEVHEQASRDGDLASLEKKHAPEISEESDKYEAQGLEMKNDILDTHEDLHLLMHTEQINDAADAVINAGGDNAKDEQASRDDDSASLEKKHTPENSEESQHSQDFEKKNVVSDAQPDLQKEDSHLFAMKDFGQNSLELEIKEEADRNNFFFEKREPYENPPGIENPSGIEIKTEESNIQWGSDYDSVFFESKDSEEKSIALEENSVPEVPDYKIESNMEESNSGVFSEEKVERKSAEDDAIEAKVNGGAKSEASSKETDSDLNEKAFIDPAESNGITDSVSNSYSNENENMIDSSETFSNIDFNGGKLPHRVESDSKMEPKEKIIEDVSDVKKAYDFAVLDSETDKGMIGEHLHDKKSDESTYGDAESDHEEEIKDELNDEKNLEGSTNVDGIMGSKENEVDVNEEEFNEAQNNKKGFQEKNLSKTLNISIEGVQNGPVEDDLSDYRISEIEDQEKHNIHTPNNYLAGTDVTSSSEFSESLPESKEIVGESDSGIADKDHSFGLEDISRVIFMNENNIQIQARELDSLRDLQQRMESQIDRLEYQSQLIKDISKNLEESLNSDDIDLNKAKLSLERLAFSLKYFGELDYESTSSWKNFVRATYRDFRKQIFSACSQIVIYRDWIYSKFHDLWK